MRQLVRPSPRHANLARQHRAGPAIDIEGCYYEQTTDDRDALAVPGRQSQKDSYDQSDFKQPKLDRQGRQILQPVRAKPPHGEMRTYRGNIRHARHQRGCARRP